MSLKMLVHASARVVWRALCQSGSVYVPGGVFAWRTFDQLDGLRATGDRRRA